MEIYSCGTCCIWKVGNIDCMITQISITGTNVSYQISYSCNSEIRTAWVSDFELKFNDSQTKKIGFK